MFQRLIADLKDGLLWRLLRENLRAQAVNYVIAIAAMVVIATTTALTAWIMKDIIDSLGAGGSRMQVFAVAGTVALIFTLKGIASYTQVVFLARAGNSIVAHQQRRVYDKLLRHGVSYFKGQASSELLMQVTYSAQSARAVIDTLATGLVRDLLTMIGLIAVMIYQQPTLFFISMIFGPMAVLGVRIILKRVRHIMSLELASLTEIINVVQETSLGIRVVKAFALEDRMAARMDSAVGQVERRANSLSRLEAATLPLVETLAGFAIAAVIALSTFSFFGTGSTGPGNIMSFVTALLMAYDPARRVAQMRVAIETSMVGVGLLFKILDEPLTLTEAPDAIPLPEGPGEVRFQNVSFAYNAGQPTLSDIDLICPAGKTTALVGPSGGGKSTLINLIMRLYDPTTGDVLIDGAPLTGATFASLRQKISFVGQDTFLFSGTVLHNIGLGRTDATEDQIIAAARAANAHDFIEKMAQGYHTPIGENGGNLSGGQRQRLAIARAILRDSPILLLDEATSALDSESESLVQQALIRLSKGRTTIVIAHRLSTVMTADKIVVIEAGRVLEQGPPQDLLRADGLFRRLHDLQFGGRAAEIEG
jgi:subfamily B ATP-binding cassette protein MsbA